MPKKIDEWLTKGRGNWRFVLIAGVVSLGAVVLAFGPKIADFMIAGAVVNKIAAYHPPEKAQVPEAPAVPDVNEKPLTWTKTVLCDKIGCWDTNTNRRLYLGAPK